MSDKDGFRSTNEFNIYGQPGYFTVNFRSPYNALHQISGFKTENDAQSWVKKTRRLVATPLRRGAVAPIVHVKAARRPA